MLIIENPVFLLIIALAILLFFLILFKISDYLTAIKAKSKKTDSKDAKTSESKEVIESKVEIEDEPFDAKNMTNYLYDRFVMNPSKDDDYSEEVVNEAFLTDEGYAEIRDRKVEIKVEPVESSEKEMLYKKIAELTNNNRTEKERLLDEFNGLSREMKLLLIENILQKID